jgi:hypothetical protein
MDGGLAPAREPGQSSGRGHRAAAAAGAVVFLAWGAWPVPALSSPLPRLAFSISLEGERHGVLGALQSCGEAGTTSVIAPAIEVALGGREGSPVDVDATERLMRDLPSGRALFLHLRVRVEYPAGPEGIDASILKSGVTQAVAAVSHAGAPIAGVMLEIQSSTGDLAATQFAVAELVLQLKAANPALKTAVIVFPPGTMRREEALTRHLAVYADAVGVGYAAGWQRDAEWIRDELGKRVALVMGADALQGADDLAAAYLDVVSETADTLVDTVWAERPTARQSAALCESVNVLSGYLAAAFVSTPMDKAPAKLGSDMGPLVASAFLDSSSTSSAFVVTVGGSSSSPRRLTVSDAGEGALKVTFRNAMNGRELTSEPARTPSGEQAQACACDVPYVVVSVDRESADQRVYGWVSVTGRGALRVEEIVARWQQYRAAQRRELNNFTADCRLSLHFEATGLGTGFDVTLDLGQFVDRTQRDWVERAVLVNGVRFGGPRGFWLPQLEPEKVLAQPLELALEEKYRYTLEGTDTVDGVPTYVIGIKPETPDALLFTGKVWIDGQSFRQVRMQLQQSGGRSSILSQVETQDYHLVAGDDGRQFNLLRSITAQQLVSAAGRSMLVERSYTFSGYRINSPDFEAARREAMESDKRMYRDTNEGLRVLRSQGGTRVVEPKKNRVKSLVGGVLYEGTYDIPIPLAGLSLVDYAFRGPGSELSVFFAGPILAANLTRHVGDRFRFGMDLALSALPQRNRVYNDADEVVGESLWTWEETVGVLANWQARPGVSLGASSYFSANYFSATGDTDPNFQAGGHGFTIQTLGELKLTRGGYTLTGTALQGNRLGWPFIGPTGGEAVAPATSFQKYSGEASKQFYLGKFTKAGINASYYGGSRLDRLSRYQPSFLSRPRIRGIPSGTDTFDAVGVAGAQLGFNAFDVVWVEGMYNRAWGRNLEESSSFRTFDGLELDLGTVGPWSTYIKGTVTYALHGNLERYNSRWGVYLLIFKPLD